MACNSCNRRSCECNTIPAPYYEDPCFQQSQTQGVQIFHSYSPVLRVATEWAVPDYGEIVTLRVSALSDIMLGVRIWNVDYGAYEVVSYDPDGGFIKVTRVAGDTTTVGTLIPGCSKFLVIPDSYIVYASDIIGVLGVEHGGTGLDSIDQGDILYGSETNIVAKLPKSTSATRYLANTGTDNNPQWDQVNLANGVTGQLPSANGGCPTGSIVGTFATSADSGWVFLKGGTIGSASSGATVRANADTSALFAYLWNNLANSEAPVSSGRGASAAADFAANKTITLPDLQGRFPLGKASAGTGSTLGGTGGALDHTHSVPAHYHGMGTGADLNITASGSHVHSVTDPGHTHTFANASACNVAGSANAYQGASQTANNAINSATTGISIQSATHTHASGNIAGRVGLVTGGVDGNAAMTSGSNNPAFLTMNWMIKL